ncbi:gephyrin-like molybdotransferase Glp [Oceanicella sp. SM1341]|uniref:molybdopterin-binding protein n=1 Tax=Oceanicella sp. SM1341 TaxID=1548889 RepID=UPI000E4DBD4C|nr:gephyrin-like molybdotransferase Glp [Oceanicella sp. SM1341]
MSGAGSEDAPPLRDDCFALPPGVEWTPVDTALAHLRASMHPVTHPEDIPLREAAGRILAVPATARIANPPAANSAVDGYGFAHAALTGEGPYRLPLAPGRAAAGVPFAEALPEGQALRILTGALIPEGVDTIVLQEDCLTSAEDIRFARGLKPGANIRRAGEDFAAGDVLLPAGARVAARDLALLSAGGLGTLRVRAALRVGVLSTGDELVEPGAAAGPGQVPDANRPMLLAMLRAWGLEPVDLGRAGDSAGAVEEALGRGAAQCSAILTTGGASAGDEDHVSAALRRAERLSLWRIAVKPGRPLALGLWEGVPVFGLPGNPVAALVTAAIFARPALLSMAGAPFAAPRGLTLPAAFSKRKKAGRREYLRARLRDGAVEVFASEGSGRISGLSWAEGLCELPDAAAEIVPGSPVTFIPWAEFGL